MIYAGAATSGSNFNPAVSLGLALTGHLPFMEAILYMAFQMLGGLVAGILHVIVGSVTVNNVTVYSPYCPGGLSPLASGIQNYNAFQGAMLELIATFFLVLAVMGTGVDKRAAPGVVGLCVGGALLMSILGIGN